LPDESHLFFRKQVFWLFFKTLLKLRSQSIINSDFGLTELLPLLLGFKFNPALRQVDNFLDLNKLLIDVLLSKLFCCFAQLNKCCIYCSC
jgi:hypothetical protein